MYFYKDGFYWKDDGTGPYSYDGVSMALFYGAVSGFSASNISQYDYKDGFYWKNDGTGPYVYDGSSTGLVA